MTLQEKKRQFMAVLGHIEKADARFVHCVKRAKDAVKAAKGGRKLAQIDKETSEEINKIINQ